MQMINQLQAGLQQQDLQEACHAVMEAAGGRARQQAQASSGLDAGAFLMASAGTLSPQVREAVCMATQIASACLCCYWVSLPDIDLGKFHLSVSQHVTTSCLNAGVASGLL